MTIKGMRKTLGLSQANFGKKYKIPLRTIQSWESGERSAPEYVMELLERAVIQDAAEVSYAKEKEKRDTMAVFEAAEAGLFKTLYERS